MEYLRRVLVVLANLPNVPRLHLDDEKKAICQAAGDRVALDIRCTGTMDELCQALRTSEFQIVHLSGHGAQKGLVLGDAQGSPYIVPAQALAELFYDYSPPIQCVVFNACFTLGQGQLTSVGVPFTIAMEGRLDDMAAIEFSKGFYEAIADGLDIASAYRKGCLRVNLSSFAENPFHSEIIKGGDLKRVLEQISSPEAGLRLGAARWIGATRQAYALPTLKDRLQEEPDPQVRYWMILALGQIGNYEAESTLDGFKARYKLDNLAVEDARILMRKLRDEQSV